MLWKHLFIILLLLEFLYMFFSLQSFSTFILIYFIFFLFISCTLTKGEHKSGFVFSTSGRSTNKVYIAIWAKPLFSKLDIWSISLVHRSKFWGIAGVSSSLKGAIDYYLERSYSSFLFPLSLPLFLSLWALSFPMEWKRTYFFDEIRQFPAFWINYVLG